MLLLEFIVARGRQDGPGAPAAQDPAVPSDVVEQAARAFDSVVGAADGGLSVTYSVSAALWLQQGNQRTSHKPSYDNVCMLAAARCVEEPSVSPRAFA